jgi:hypothetical protein
MLAGLLICSSTAPGWPTEVGAGGEPGVTLVVH